MQFCIIVEFEIHQHFIMFSHGSYSVNAHLLLEMHRCV